MALGSGRLTGCLCRGPFHSCVVVKQLSQRVGIHTNFMFCQHLAMLCQGLKPAPGQKITKLAGEKERETERGKEKENCLAYRIAHTRINTISEVLSKMQRQFSIKLHIIGIPFVSSSSGPGQTKSGRLVEEFAAATTVHCEKATPVLKGSSTR